MLVGDADQRDFAQGMAFALAFLFYLSSLVFGMTLAGSVVEEKQSRIVEIIATRSRCGSCSRARCSATRSGRGPDGAVRGDRAGRAELHLVRRAAADRHRRARLVPRLLPRRLPAIACLWAVAGALATRTEDLQSTSTPITLLLLAIFFGSAFLDGTAQVVASYCRRSACSMPQRLLAGTRVVGAGVALVIAAFAARTRGSSASGSTGAPCCRREGGVSLRRAWSAPE